MSAKRWMLLIAVVAAGLWLRGRELTRTALWADEAESSLNALTILQHGYPTSEYLGQPLFENVLHVEWPESEEYEFRDASYSKDGIACYHGWLPLYAIALSMRVFGVEPDEVAEVPTLRHGADEMQRRTWVPRVPALLFSAAFLCVVFFALREMGGEEAAWAGLVFAALLGRGVDFGWQARYYAPTLLFSMAGGWAVWRVVEYGRGRDALTCGLVLVLLFHTHVLSCLALCVSLAVCALARRGWRDGLRLASIAGSVVAVGALPWMLWSGFFGALGQPSARELGAGGRELRVLGPALLGALVAAVALRRFTFTRRPTTWWLAAVWASLALLGFHQLMPAATFFVDRLELLLMPAYVIAIATAAGTAARALSVRWSSVLAAGILLVFLVATRQYRQGWWSKLPRARATFALVERIGELVTPDLRTYATPNRHLALAYYSGIPIQSIAPVRKSWLEAYPGEILLVAETTFGEPPSWLDLQRRASEVGVDLTREEAIERAHFFWGWWIRMEISERVRATIPDSVATAAWEAPLIEEAKERLEKERSYYDWRWEGSLLFRELYEMDPFGFGRVIHGATSYWQNYFYRFVAPASRRGEKANYAQLLPGSTAEVRPELGCVLYHVPARGR